MYRKIHGGLAQDQERLLGILSQGGEIEDQSPCSFCKHFSTTECPMMGVSKLGICKQYVAIDLSDDEAEERILAYLQKPNLLAMLR